jgi:DNA-binding response OmpR family regulator
MCARGGGREETRCRNKGDDSGVRSQVEGLVRALVVEDEVGVAEAVAFALTRDGMPAEIAGTLEEGRRLAPGKSLFIVDLGLPDGSGYGLVADLARAPGVRGVLVLTSRDQEVDEVAALEAGADDFVQKPFSPRALVARARAVLRRGKMPRRPAGGLELRLDEREATYDGRPLALTKTELDLLALLAASPGRVFSRGQIVARIWGDGHALTERTIDSHVKLLRRKLEGAGAPASLVASVHGVGFKLATAP